MDKQQHQQQAMSSSCSDPPSPSSSNNGAGGGQNIFFVPANQRNTSKISAATQPASNLFLYNFINLIISKFSDDG